MSIELVTLSNSLILCHPLLLLPPIFPSIRVFSNESVLPIRWPKYWSFSFNISPSSEHLGPISFRMDWLDLLAVQGTLKSLLQHHSSKASILQHSRYQFSFEISYIYIIYITTSKVYISCMLYIYIERESSLIAQLIKNPHAMQETLVDSWVRKIHWRKIANHSSILGLPLWLSW